MCSPPSNPPQQIEKINNVMIKDLDSVKQNELQSSGTGGTDGTDFGKEEIGANSYKPFVCYLCGQRIMDNDWLQNNFTENKPAHQKCYDQKQSELRDDRDYSSPDDNPKGEE